MLIVTIGIMVDSVTLLLFPCFDAQVENPSKKNCRSSALVHLISSLILSILAALGAAGATFFLMQGAMQWTIFTGCSTALIISLASYVILRCTLGQKIKNVKAKKDRFPRERVGLIDPKSSYFLDKAEKLELAYIERVHSYPGDLSQEEKTQLSLSQIDATTHQIIFNQTFLLTIRCQNLFESNAQVIVNAANTHLGGGGGIDGEIHSKGGTEYTSGHQSLKHKYNSQFTQGFAAMIGSGQLKNLYEIENVIVVAGPCKSDMTDPNIKDNQLYSCYYNSLLLACQNHKTSIAFPAISTGIYGFDKKRAADLSLKAIHDFAKNYPDSNLTISIHYLKPTEKILEAYQDAILVS